MPAGSFVRAVEDRGRLVAGVSGDRMLFGALDPLTNQLEGFEVDLLRQVSRAIFGDDQHLELRVVTEADAPDLLRQGGVDVVAREITMTCAARARVDFSEEYFHASERVLVARNSPARGIEDLRGKQVCAAAGSLALTTVSAAASHPIPVAAADWNECMVRFQQGEVDAIAADQVTLLGFTQQDPYTRIVGGDLADEHYGLAVAQGHPDLVRFVNGALEQMRSDGRWTALAARWLGRFGPTPTQPAARYSDR
ncbi:MAG TPA: glutamate ABC transporter substrate-binding protein [Terriglobales bacterium]|nr:glutamate ABC transporter substrate-binding protein [Terriglobales bacterium]